MEATLLEKSKDGLIVKLLIKGTTPAFVNSLRRAIVEEVPTLAIEDVEFRKNNSILYDEIIAHRLGLVPLKTDLKGYRMLKPGDEPGKANQVTFSLKTTKQGNVIAGDMDSSDKSVVPVYPDMLVTKLIKGQSLEFEAVAILGKGKDHSKWCPAHAYYYNEPKITVTNDPKLLEEFRANYPPQIFDKSGKIDKALISTPQLIDACEGVSKLVEIERKEDSFVFVFESWGQLTPKQILIEAIEQLDAQFDDVLGLMK
ncbi:MAG: DNA-directed RNA polymerase subunit D [Nanoarchaeota archaeon]|nr:DNA-directed RNA polymerase subunit D [Nanoarchaeota archaeon]